MNPASSVVGRPFSFELLEKATDWDEASVSQALEELWQRRIIESRGATEYDFTHDRLREVACAELSLVRQRYLHRRVARAESVKILIRYVETVKYEDGNYTFSFPMVVGPRYNPNGTPTTANISPPVTPQGTRAGHDIAVQVSVDAGVPVNFLRSLTHDVDIQKAGASKA
jgi:hypothetical protein